MKKSFLPLLALITMASCTQNDMDLKESNDQSEIKLSSAVGSIAQTRTSYDLTTPTTAVPFEATVLVSKVANLYPAANLLNGSAYKVIFTDATTPTGFSDGTNPTPVYYPADGTDVYLWGLYPYGKCVTTSPAASEWLIGGGGATAQYTFTGKEDVMYAPEIKSNKTEVKTAVNYANTKLNFKHLLTKLIVKAKGDAAAVSAFGDITDITLVAVGAAAPTANIANKVKIDLGTDATLATPATHAFTGTEASFPFYIYDVLTTPATPTQTNNAFAALTSGTTPAAITVPLSTDYANGQEIAYSMVQPIDVAAPGGTTAYLLKVKTTKGEAAGFNVPVVLKDATSTSGTPVEFTGSTASKTFTIQLTFSAAEIKSIVAVGQWVPQGNSDIEIQ